MVILTEHLDHFFDPLCLCRIREQVCEVLESHQDPIDAQAGLQHLAQQHSYARLVIKAYLNKLERQVGPANLAGVLFSL